MVNQPILDIPTPDWGLPYLEPKRYKGIKGGRSGGKSHFFAELIAEKHIVDKDFQTVCVREIQKSLKFSAKKLIEDKIRLFNCQHLFTFTLTEIKRIDGEGIIIFQGLQDHTADSIKSLEGFDLAWVEEAQSISSISMELLLPTIRAVGSEIWFSWNPRSPEDPIEKLFSDLNEDMILTHVNYYDNPFCPAEIFREAQRHKEYSPETYDHVWLGVANSGTESAFIRPEWINACVDAHKVLHVFDNNYGRDVVGYDCADEEEFGSDANATTRLKGSIVQDIKEWKDHRDVGESARSVYHDAKLNHCEIVFDAVGMGAGTKAEFKRLNNLTGNERQVKSVGFIAGAKVEYPDMPVSDKIEQTNADFFTNNKAQLWWSGRQRIYNTYLAVKKGKKFNIDEVISIPSKHELTQKLCAELSRPKIMYDNNARVMVEKKKDMAKRGIKSPNISDSLLMALFIKNDDIYIG